MDKEKKNFIKDIVAWGFLFLASACEGTAIVMGFLWGAFYPRYLNEGVIYAEIFWLILGAIFFGISCWLKFAKKAKVF